MSTPTLARLVPGRWTPVPGTRCEVRWDGVEEISVHRREDALDLSAVPAPGYVLARIVRAGRAGPPWPVLAPTLRTG
jgi:hypothetical protein